MLQYYFDIINMCEGLGLVLYRKRTSAQSNDNLVIDNSFQKSDGNEYLTDEDCKVKNERRGSQ